MSYLQNLPGFIGYLLASVLLLAAFVTAYVRVTPYAELPLIREGNVAACLSLLGAIFGFALPLASAISHSISLLDMVVWGIVALLVQVGFYKGFAFLMPEIVEGIPRNQIAHGLLLGGGSLVIGLINAACMSY